ncbi:hypothetical protein J7394_17855 [Ruegeria sp. R13_0]|uniref:hypothetical protein n=1 Tax=Ruegeria sp. R13_0 TaxID=2821099 RepID=UPI001AD9EB1C|nr:hypothetical protein [Ruegeria sp. R13_0]MBO9436091.1 hypothetical protein [Ruegeria sp. R13_0]
MSDVVWLSNMHRNPSATYGYRPVGFPDVPRPPRDNEIGVAFSSVTKRQTEHLPIEDHEFPRQLYAVRRWAHHKRRKRNIFSAGGALVVSSTSANILRDHDMGSSRLVPVELLHPDQKTKLDGDWHYLVLGDGKPCFEGDSSKGVTPLGDPVELFMVRGNDHVNDGDLVFSEMVLTGPDIWFDPVIIDAPILSDRLATALNAAKVAKDWDLLRCNVISD